MHPNSLKNLKLFKPGISGNPRGNATKLPEELKAIKSLTQVEVTKLISKYARMSVDELVDAKNDSNLSVIDLTIVSIFSKSIEFGDFGRLSFLLDRCVGKIKEVVEDEEATEEREALEKLTAKELYELIKPNFETPEAS